MAHIYRLTLALLLGFSSLAHAAFPVPQMFWVEKIGRGTLFPSFEAACSAAESALSASTRPSTWTNPSFHRSHCASNLFVGYWTGTYNGSPVGGDYSNYQYRTYIWLVNSCPANSSSSAGDTCTCNSGYKQEGSQCVAQASPTTVCTQASIDHHSWGVAGNTVYPGRIEDDSSQCYIPYPDSRPDVGCSIKFEADISWKNDDGSWSTRGRYVPEYAGTSGVACAPGGSNGPEPTYSNPKAEPIPATCKDGYSGQVNGVSVCVPNVGKSGVDYVPKTEVEENGRERVEITTSTSCSAGKCTTTTTTKTTDKSTGATTTDVSTKTVSDTDYCRSNAGSVNCPGGKPPYGGKGADDGDGDGDGDGSGKGSSSFGGSCSAGFTCKGDAIQCAVAKEQHKRNCEANDVDNDEFRAYLAARTVTGKVTGSLEGNGSVDIGALMSGTSDRFLSGKGACPADRVIQGPNWKFSIPYSTICPYLEILGNILVVITSIAAVRILANRS